MKMKIDLSEEGLGMFFKEYEILSLETLWKKQGQMLTSFEVTEAVNQKLSAKGESISRASIINFLQDMNDQGLLEKDTTTGKGGHRGLYRPRYDESGMRRHLVKTVLQRLQRDFPEEAGSVIEGFQKRT